MNRIIRIAIDTDRCHECDKQKAGVRFRLLDDTKQVGFLCWEHFRLNTETLLEAGVIRRQPRVPLNIYDWTPPPDLRPTERTSRSATTTARSPEGSASQPTRTGIEASSSTIPEAGQSNDRSVSQTQGTGSHEDCAWQPRPTAESRDPSETDTRGHDDAS